MRALPNVVAGRRRRGALIALAMTVATVVGFSTGAFATPLAAGGGAAAAKAPAVTEYTLGQAYFAGKGASRSSVVGNGGVLVVGGAYRVRWWGEQARPRLTLQRKVGSGAWRTTAAKVALTDDGIVTRTPAYSTSARTRTVAYRIVSSAYSSASGRVRGTSRSHVLTVVYENQQRYTGLARTIYEAAKPYCPSTAVHVGTLDGAAGDYRTGTLLIRAIPEIAAYEPIDVRAVALHECSHERQWLNYGGSAAGHVRMAKDAKALFSDWTKPADVTTPYRYEDPDAAITPIEHAADCGAQALNPGGYLGYGGWCSDAELAAGKRLLLGRRY
ncbi:hypothetical protein [uncultured Amnibacterium sp.]|uniref:hypothetical protein n=1 Tax=uncultured Amnibacterium sp. TaxID=1631851 RepID=UPI0035C96F4F